MHSSSIHYDRDTTVLIKSWRCQWRDHGSLDERTLNTLYELCLRWQCSGILEFAIKTEASQIVSWVIKAKDTRLFNFLLANRIDVEKVDGNGCSPLMQATSLGLDHMVRQLLKVGANVHQPSKTKHPVHIAAKKAHHAIATYLLDAGADPNALDSNGRTAVYWASYYGHNELVKLLLSKGAHADSSDPPGIFPLHCAVSQGYIEIVKMLINAGAELERVNFGLTPVLVAINYSQDQILQYLLKKGASAHSSIPGGDHALHSATRKGLRRCATLLLDAGVEVDVLHPTGYTALALAAGMGSDDLVDRLLSRSAQVNHKGQSGRTPLIEAADNGHATVVRQLLYAGADIASTSDHDFTALHFAAQGGHLDVMNILLNSGADPRGADAPSSVLDLAVRANKQEVVERLVDTGVDVNIRSVMGSTPLLYACSTKNSALATFLLQHGAETDLANNQGYTPLMVACSAGDLGIAQKLIHDYKADVICASPAGLTPLHCAAVNGYTEIVTFLLSQGADSNSEFLGNTTALSMAAWQSHEDVISQLAGVTANPLQLDCFGLNSVDWSQSMPSIMSLILKDTGKPVTYEPTSAAVRKSAVRKSIRDIVEGLLISRVAYDGTFPILARCLFIMHDITEAEHAWQLHVYDHIDTNAPLPYMISCDLCDKRISGKLHVCTVCPERNLCDACMDEYKEKKKEMRGCKGHEYHGIVHRHWEGEYEWSLMMMNARGQTADEWLRHVGAAYGRT